MTEPIPVGDSADREAWLLRRREGITATDVAKLASGSLLARQALYKSKTEGESFRGNKHTERGNRLEPVVASWVDANYGIPSSGILYANAERPEFLATPDCFIWDEEQGALVEIKTTFEDWSDKIPLKILRQIYWQAMVLDATFVGLAWWQVDDKGQPFGMEPNFIEIKVDHAELARLIAVADEYLAWVDAGCPSFDSDLPLEVLEAIEVHVQAKQDIASAEKTIRAYLASSEQIQKDGLNRATPVGGIAYRVTPSSEFDKAAAAEAEPALFEKWAAVQEKYRKPKTSTALTISAPKKEAA